MANEKPANKLPDRRTRDQLIEAITDVINVGVHRLSESVKAGPLDGEEIDALDKFGRLLAAFERPRRGAGNPEGKSDEELLREILDDIPAHELEAALSKRKGTRGRP